VVVVQHLLRGGRDYRELVARGVEHLGLHHPVHNHRHLEVVRGLVEELKMLRGLLRKELKLLRGLLHEELNVLQGLLHEELKLPHEELEMLRGLLHEELNVLQGLLRED
jgi:hypothetical protein